MHRLCTRLKIAQGVVLRVQTRERAHIIYYSRYIPDIPYFWRKHFNGSGEEKYPSLGGDLGVLSLFVYFSPQTPLLFL